MKPSQKCLRQEFPPDEDIPLGDIANKSVYNTNNEVASIQADTGNELHERLGDIAIDSSTESEVFSLPELNLGLVEIVQLAGMDDYINRIPSSLFLGKYRRGWQQTHTLVDRNEPFFNVVVRQYRRCSLDPFLIISYKEFIQQFLL